MLLEHELPCLEVDSVKKLPIVENMVAVFRVKIVLVNEEIASVLLIQIVTPSIQTVPKLLHYYFTNLSNVETFQRELDLSVFNRLVQNILVSYIILTSLLLLKQVSLLPRLKLKVFQVLCLQSMLGITFLYCREDCLSLN